MSSASTIAPASQTSNSASATQNSGTNNAATRSNMRSNSQVKNADGVRRQSPIDAAPRRPPAPKAWASGTNPLVQKSSSTAQSNGVATPSKTPNMNPHKETGLSDKHAHDRSIAAFGAAVGSVTTILTKAGEKYEGLMAGATLVPGNAKITIKMTKKVQQNDNSTANGVVAREAALVGASPDHAMTFDMRDIVEIDLADLSLIETAKMANGSSSKFRTDADISGNLLRGERTLQKWVPDEPDSTDYSLDGRGAGDWDQFATAQKMTGLESTYHENEYTTALDKSSLNYRMREAQASRMEREILGSASTNVHLREERGQQAENDADDEEAKYSGVRRDDRSFPLLLDGGPNKYMPPAKRAPTGQPTVSGAPVDPAIVSTTKPTTPAIRVDKESVEEDAEPVEPAAAKAPVESESQALQEEEGAPNPSLSPQRVVPFGGQTEGVEDRLLHSFREFKDTEKQKLLDRKRQQASQDRTAKLNELLRFSKTFKLKTPIPGDLVGILAKDPVKQEAIIEKAKREHEDSTSADVSPSASVADTSARKVDLPQMAIIPERQQTINKGRGGFSTAAARGAAQQAVIAGRGVGNNQRPIASKPVQPHQIPAPIPILDGRLPPIGPMADQNALASPQRSNLQTPTSATSFSKFNLSVRAAEFRPNAAAPSFNRSTSSNAPSSPSSAHRTTSMSRAASPSAFFGQRKPKPQSDRPSVGDNFNPVQRMKADVAAKIAEGETDKSEGTHAGSSKDFASNGGIPYAYQTGPRWNVRQENEEKTYKLPFERAAPPTPQANRTVSTHHMPYQNHMAHMPTGTANIPQISTPQHMHSGGPHHYPAQYDDGHARPMMPMGPVYSSPSITSRQPSAYASPMVQGAQLAYGGQQPFGVGVSQMPMQMRYPGTSLYQGGQMAAPMMVPQQSNGQFMQMPQQYGTQMPMYSPNPAHVYPQANGYGSPGRAPMMMQQGSQQGHHSGQPMMYTMSQGGPVAYPQPGQAAMSRGYSNQYGSSPQQPYGMQQRTMSGGYGHQKMMQHQHMQPNHGPPMNAPQQPAAYTQMEIGHDEGK